MEINPTQSSQELLPQYHKTKKFIICGIAFLIILVVTLFFLLVTFQGLKILNYFINSPSLTLRMVEMANSKIVAIPFYTAQIRFSVASSTVLSRSPREVHFVTKNNDIFVIDPYNNSFTQVEDTMIPKDQLQPFVIDSFSNLLLEFRSQKPIVILNKNEIEIYDSSSATRLYLDQETYKVKRISFSRTEGRAVVDFSYPVNIQENIFGDFASRESVYIRTDPDGSHDYLWSKWEEAYFHCKECVNRAYDSDKDGLYNEKEFLFGTNPLRADTNENLIDDLEELKQGKSPLTGDVLTDLYKSAVNLFLVPYPQIEIGSAHVRTPAILYRLVIPPQAFEFEFTYKYIGKTKSYLTLFFNDTLLFKASPVEYMDYTTKRVSLEAVKGKQGAFYLISNSVGRAGNQLLITDFKIFDDNNHLLKTLPANLQ